MSPEINTILANSYSLPKQFRDRMRHMIEHPPTYDVNCISAALYIVGLTDMEMNAQERDIWPPNKILAEHTQIIRSSTTIDTQAYAESDLIGFARPANGSVVHLAVPLQYDHLVVERPSVNLPLQIWQLQSSFVFQTESLQQPLTIKYFKLFTN